MRISKEIDYGIRAMIVISTNGNGLYTSKQISEKFQIPYNFLSLILPKLVRAGLVLSVQGPKGGYKLAKKPAEVNFLQIIEAIDGPVDLINCNTPGQCKLEAFCGMVDVWGKLKNNMEHFFKQVTLERFANQTYPAACCGSRDCA